MTEEEAEGETWPSSWTEALDRTDETLMGWVEAGLLELTGEYRWARDLTIRPVYRATEKGRSWASRGGPPEELGETKDVC